MKKYINSRSSAVVLQNDSRQDCGLLGLKPHVHLIVNKKLPGDDTQEEKSAICDADVFQIREKILTYLRGVLSWRNDDFARSIGFEIRRIQLGKSAGFGPPESYPTFSSSFKAPSSK